MAGCDLPVDEVGDSAVVTEDESGVDRVPVLGEERLPVCVEGGGRREEHRPTEGAMTAPPLRASGKLAPVANPASTGPSLPGRTKKTSATRAAVW
jgi:hypothetical protein